MTRSTKSLTYGCAEAPPAADMVNHPPHYQTPSGIEAIEVMEQYGLGLHLGTAMKYLLRAHRKGNQKQDLEKAHWYVRRWEAFDCWDKDPCAQDGHDGGICWHTPDEIVAAFGLAGTLAGEAAQHILEAACFGEAETRIENARQALAYAIIGAPTSREEGRSP